MDRNLLTEQFPEENLLIADGFDEAIIGTTLRDGMNIIVYSTIKCLEVLMKNHGLGELEAEEYFQFNVAGAYVGERTPIFVEDRGL